ncbi:unnamed protein product, partial [Discosporangium mesarthrocarpum]
GQGGGNLGFGGGGGGSEASSFAGVSVDPLLVDLDSEGCTVLLSTICRVMCNSRALLLPLVPASLRPPVSVEGVPLYVASRVRAARKALEQQQALRAPRGDDLGASGLG